MSTVRHPPGRAGRLWLQRRLEVARRGAGVLEVKLTILHQEQERFAALAEQTKVAWEQACADAERWLLRATSVGGQRSVRPDAQVPPAGVTTRWASVMGVRYPQSATVRFPPRPAAAPVAATAAGPLAVTAHRQALEAGVAHATAQAAAQVVAAEVVTTQHRLRAIEDRWVPGLEAALRSLEVSLDELDRAEAVRLRWAAQRSRTGR